MAKTTNILDLNNRLEKVEKENIAQNSYTSLKNKPKINNVTLTGNKSLTDLGAAAASDLGVITDLTTTDKNSVVAAINEVNNIGNDTDLGNVQGSGTITLSDAVTNYRFVMILIGYYATGYPCYGYSLLPVSALHIGANDLAITVAITDIDATISGRVNISFLSATSVKVVNTSSVYTRVIGIA